MKITGIETFTVGAGWKNWLFVRVAHRRRHPRRRRGHAERLHPHHRGRRARARAPRDRRGSAPHHRAREADARQRLARRRPYPPHGDRRGRGRLLGHPRQVARRADAPAARRPGARQRARLRQRLVPRPSARRRRSSRPRARCSTRASRRSSSTRSARPGLHRARGARACLRRSAARCATALPPDTADPDRRPRPLHRDRGAAGGAALAPTSTSTGGRSRPRATAQETVHEVGRAQPDPGRDRRDVRHRRPVLHAGRGRRRQHLPARADVARRHRPGDGRWRTSRWRTAAGSRRTRAAGRWPPRSACSSRRACRTS